MGWSDRLNPRRNNFDFLRFMLAGAVVLSHSYVLTERLAPGGHVGANEPLARLTRREMSLGMLAVNWFFLISGFLIAQSWSRSKSVRDYFSKRALRIYPGFAALTLLTALVFVPLATDHAVGHGSPGWGKIAYRILILDGYEAPATFPNNPSAQMNSSVWTIPYEVGCYVVLAVLGLTGGLSRRWVTVPLFVLMLALAYSFAVYHNGPVWGDYLPKNVAYHVTRIAGVPAVWPRYLVYFLAGTLFFQYRHRLPYSHALAVLCGLALIASTLVPNAILITLPLFGTYLLFWFAFHPRVPLHEFGKHGDFSYGLYLYAFPIQQLLIAPLGLEGRPLTLFFVALPVAALAGVLSWHGVEKWFLRRGRPVSAPQGRRSGQEVTWIDPGRQIASLGMEAPFQVQFGG